MKWEMFAKRSICIYVRNKARYNPETKGKDFLCVNVTNFAGTTIGDIKEEVKRKCHNSLKLDDLFLDNKPLADDRSVAHFNLEDGTILETTSNPFWVTCLSIKQCEVAKEQKENPDDPHIQNWTKRSLARKRTLLSVLLNSKGEYPSQPQHFPTLDDLVHFLENLNKKGATMNPHYTQKDLKQMYEDYHSNDIGHSDDPLGTFIHRHAVRLGLRDPDPVQYNNRIGEERRNHRGPANIQAKNSKPQPGPARQRAVAKNKTRTCEDCEANDAEVYCEECQNATGGQGLALCGQCSHALHLGAARRRHSITDILQAPKSAKPYVPHAFKAPFSILVALLSGLSERPPKLSMTEDEVKERAQPLTDTDLQDKQNGRYVGGFECMENTLMLKGFVQREDSRNPTYALTQVGHNLAEQLFHFQQTVQRFFKSQGIPKITLKPDPVCSHRRICLIIDEQERDKQRLLNIMSQKNVDAQVRQLPAGDYLWILTPPLQDPRKKYMQRMPAQELVLPFLVERKSWEDLQDSIRTKRFHKQVNNMLGSGIQNLFYLMEGSIGCMRYKPTEDHQKRIKNELENLLLKNGFYVNYTGSWFKSAVWLAWMTALISYAHNTDSLLEDCIPYTEYTRRTCRQPTEKTVPVTDTRPGQCSVWTADKFTDLIFREEERRGALVNQVVQQSSRQQNTKSVLIIQNLEAYNKKRQTLLNKCLLEVYGDLDNMSDRVQGKLSACLQNMLHYDIMSYWQLHIQVMTGVYVVRTENDQDSQRIHQAVENGKSFKNGPQPENGGKARTHSTSQGRGRRKRTDDDQTRNNNVGNDFVTKLQWGKGRRLDDGYSIGIDKTSNLETGRVLQAEKEGNSEVPTRRQKRQDKQLQNPCEEDETVTRDMFATDSQTEQFMIQQAFAMSVQQEDVGGLYSVSDDDVGDNSSRDCDAQDEEYQLKLAMQKSLETSQMEHENVNTQDFRYGEKIMSLDNSINDIEEELNAVLMQSGKEAQNKSETCVGNQQLNAGKSVLPLGGYAFDDDPDLSSALKQSLLETSGSNHILKSSEVSFGQESVSKLRNVDAKKVSITVLEHSSKKSHHKEMDVNEPLIQTSLSLSDSQDEQLQYVLRLSEKEFDMNIGGHKMLTQQVEENNEDEDSVCILDDSANKLKDQSSAAVLGDRDQNISLALRCGQEKINTLQNDKNSLSLGEDQEHGISIASDSQDEELQMVLRMSKQEYENALSQTNKLNSERLQFDLGAENGNCKRQPVEGTGSFSQPLTLEDSQEFSGCGSEEDIFIEENTNVNWSPSKDGIKSVKKTLCTSMTTSSPDGLFSVISKNSQGKNCDHETVDSFSDNVLDKRARSEDTNKEDLAFSASDVDGCHSQAKVGNQEQTSVKDKNGPEFGLDQHRHCDRDTNDNDSHLCGKCTKPLQEMEFMTLSKHVCTCSTSQKSSNMAMNSDVEDIKTADSSCVKEQSSNDGDCLNKSQTDKLLDSEGDCGNKMLQTSPTCSKKLLWIETYENESGSYKSPFPKICKDGVSICETELKPNILVEDSQADDLCDGDDNIQDRAVMETQHHTSHQQNTSNSDDGDIDVIPPSPEKNSPVIFRTSHLSSASPTGTGLVLLQTFTSKGKKISREWDTESDGRSLKVESTKSDRPINECVHADNASVGSNDVQIFESRQLQNTLPDPVQSQSQLLLQGCECNECVEPCDCSTDLCDVTLPDKPQSVKSSHSDAILVIASTHDECDQKENDYENFLTKERKKCDECGNISVDRKISVPNSSTEYKEMSPYLHNTSYLLTTDKKLSIEEDIVSQDSVILKGADNSLPSEKCKSLVVPSVDSISIREEEIKITDDLITTSPKRNYTATKGHSVQSSEKNLKECQTEDSMEEWRNKISKQIVSVSKDVKEINSNINVLLTVSDSVLKSEIIQREINSPKKPDPTAVLASQQTYEKETCGVDISKVKQEKGHNDCLEQISQADKVTDNDEEFARKLQEQFDMENKILKKQKNVSQNRRSTRTSSHGESTTLQGLTSSLKTFSSTEQQKGFAGKTSTIPVDTSKDEELARQLAETLKHEEMSSIKQDSELMAHFNDTANDEIIARQLTEELNVVDHNSRRPAYDDGLHKRGLEWESEDSSDKRRKQTMLEKDMILAKKLSQMDKVTPQGVSTRKRHASVETVVQEPQLKLCRKTSGGRHPSMEDLWSKKLHSLHNKAKKESDDQLATIRKEQNDRFRSLRLPIGSQAVPFSSVTSPWKQNHGSTTVTSGSRFSDYEQELDSKFSEYGQGNEVHITLDDDGYISYSSEIKTPSKTKLSPISSPSSLHTWGSSSGYVSVGASFSNSQLASQSSSQWTDSKDSVSSSSKTMKSKCGNCGEVGHTRIDKACPRYYSQEESSRRKEKQEKAKQRIEEKAQLEKQTRDELEHHQTVLEDIALRIQQEKNGLTKTLKKLDKKAKQRDKRRR